MLEPHQKKIIELLFEQEKLLAELYTLFAGKFPEHRDFWSGLAEEERRHAAWIKKFYQAEKKELVAFEEGKTRSYTLNTFIDYVKDLIRQAEGGEMSSKRAAALALDLEKSLIEKDAFTRFKILDQDLKGVMTKLDVETRQHIARTQEMLDKLR